VVVSNRAINKNIVFSALVHKIKQLREQKKKKRKLL